MRNSWIKIHFEYKRKRITLPFNPEEIPKDKKSGSQLAEVVGLGEIAIPTTPRLQTFSIKSFFWQQFINDNPTTSFKTVKEYVDWFSAWQNSMEPARFIAEAPLNYDLLVICEGFKDTVKAGEEFDVYFELDLRQYRPYGAVLINQKNGKAEIPEVQRTNNKTPIENPYTVKTGDFLASIAKTMTGDDSKWQELYNITENKAVIGANPDLILPGQLLTIPESWRGQ